MLHSPGHCALCRCNRRQCLELTIGKCQWVLCEGKAEAKAEAGQRQSEGEGEGEGEG